MKKPPGSRRDRIPAMLADLKMPGALGGWIRSSITSTEAYATRDLAVLTELECQ